MHSARADTFVRRLGFDKGLSHKLRSSDRVFVIGMGPSLRKFDLDKLDGELVFGVNHASTVGVRCDVLFIADDRRLVPELRPVDTPLVTIDVCLKAQPEFFAGLKYFADIKAVNYGLKIPAILGVGAYEVGFPFAYWTGSVVTDLVVPFAVECGMKQVICLGLDGVDGSFPMTHAWGLDKLTLDLQVTSESIDAEVLPTSALVSHMQERVCQLAAKEGVEVLNVTPGGTTEAIPRGDAIVLCPPGTWRELSLARNLHRAYVALGTSVFRLEILGQHNVLLRFDSAAGLDSCSNVHLDGTSCVVDTGFLGDPLVSLKDPASARFLTTRQGFDRFAWRTATQSFNTTLSSFPVFSSAKEAAEFAKTIEQLAEASRKRSEVGARLGQRYLTAMMETNR